TRKTTRSATMRNFWYTEFMKFMSDMWGELCLRVYTSRIHQLFVEATFSSTYNCIIKLYDEEYSVQNSALHALMTWLTIRNPRRFGVRPKDINIWFPGFKSVPATPSRPSSIISPESKAYKSLTDIVGEGEETDPELKALRQISSGTLENAAEMLTKFSQAPSPLHKLQLLRSWGQSLSLALEHISKGVIDPDLMLFLRGWTFATAGIPNATSQLRYLRDYVLDQLDPEDVTDPENYEHCEIIAILQRTIESLRAMRNTKDWLVIKIEGGIVSNMSDAPSQALNLLIAIISKFQKRVDRRRNSFVFPGAGFAPILSWFARDWDLSITENFDENTTTVSVLNPDDFPLTPHVCEAIMLKLSRFER
ncbi:MAG: hypothetical protein K2Q09_01775, partial [Phycisphaerales bacterium]|nr:hypothetical protein [Phycisphaerales bacterium]